MSRKCVRNNLSTLIFHALVLSPVPLFMIQGIPWYVFGRLAWEDLPFTRLLPIKVNTT